MLPMAQTPIASKSAPLSVWDFPAIFPLCGKIAGILSRSGLVSEMLLSHSTLVYVSWWIGVHLTVPLQDMSTSLKMRVNKKVEVSECPQIMKEKYMITDEVKLLIYRINLCQLYQDLRAFILIHYLRWREEWRTFLCCDCAKSLI